MTVSKDAQNSRAPSQHRLSVGATAPSLPTRQANGRTHSHSVSVGSINPQHRINRRKSSASFAPNNMAALAAAAKEASTDSTAMANRIKPSPRLGHSTFDTVNPSAAAAAALGDGQDSGSHATGGSAVIDGPPLSSMSTDKTSKARARRASEGSRLSKAEGKRTSGIELRCETCGKGYKHGSCLTKHLWEHDPAWSYTSKLLISKHQQVQLLEAASVLVKMQDSAAPVESSTAIDSDGSSNSPAASGSSDLHDDDASSRSSSPPLREDSISSVPVFTARGRPGRKNSNSSAFSQSYQSASTGFFATSMPNEVSQQPWSSHSRPSTSGAALGIRYENDEQADIAVAAEGLLSCSLGTPSHGPTMLPTDIPPVPPLPAKFVSSTSQQEVCEDVDMNDEDEGVFGRMEQY